MGITPEGCFGVSFLVFPVFCVGSGFYGGDSPLPLDGRFPLSSFLSPIIRGLLEPAIDSLPSDHLQTMLPYEVRPSSIFKWPSSTSFVAFVTFVTSVPSLAPDCRRM